MESEQSEPLEHILGHLPMGVAILGCPDLRIDYINPYLLSLLEEPWRSQSVIGHRLYEVVPEEVRKAAQPVLEELCITGKSLKLSDIPYEGFLTARGRTYWRISIEPSSPYGSSPFEQEKQPGENSQKKTLLVMVEDVTDDVRLRLHIEAIHRISSAIAGPSALPLVLDRILQAVQEMVGSTRCAVLLVNYPTSHFKPSPSIFKRELDATTGNPPAPVPKVTVAAQRGLHLSAKNWHPELSGQLLLGRVMQTQRTLVIPNTSTTPEVDFPLLNDNGVPRRPGSVLSVPIFEPTPDTGLASERTNGCSSYSRAVLGTIEVYHRRARGYPTEEVELLEQFAQQAGLAIQNARLFLEQASARERTEAEVIARTAELAQRNLALQEAQAAQELESKHLQLLLERLPSGVILISAEDDRIKVINRQAAQLLLRMGWVPFQDWKFPALSANPRFADLDRVAKSAIGLNIEELLQDIMKYSVSGSVIQPEEQPSFLALHQGKAKEIELQIIQPDGQSLFLLANAAPLRANNGTITNAVLVWHDITRLKTLERAREDFFTTMAHELKTPLANIRAHLSALQASDLQWSSKEQLDFLQTADEQVERLVGMINQFLDASRVEAGALRLEFEPILLPEMFEDLQDRLEALITSSHRQLEVNIPPNLPAVLADYELIMSVLSNLLSNAFRYAPKGDTVRLEAEAIFEDDQQQPIGVELRVIDRGEGITEERQAELFTRFSTFAAMRRPAADRPGQPVTASEKRRASGRWSQGSGLGLYISRGIIEAHGSTLRVKSSPGQGATFAFTLAVASLSKKEV